MSVSEITLYKKVKILLIEDLQSDVKLIWRTLERSEMNFEGRVVETRDGYLKELEEFKPDVILSDHTLPSFNSHEALEILGISGYKLPFILITATVSEDFAVDVIKRGAVDYILKDRLERLPSAVLNSLEKFRLERERQIFFDEIIRNEKHYRSLIGSIHDAIILIDESNRLIYQSHSAENIIGYSFEELKDRPAFMHVLEEDIPLCFALMERAYEEPGLPVSEQYRIRHKMGHIVWVEGTLTNMLLDESAKAYILNYRDITSRKVSEELLRQSEFRYRQIVETAQEGIWLIDEEDRTTFVNHKMCSILDREKSGIIGRHIFDFIAEEDKESVTNSLFRTKSGNVQNIQVRFITGAGKLIWTSLAGNPIYNDEGIYGGTLAMVSDIDENMHLHALLNRINILARVGHWEADMVSRQLNWSQITREIHEIEDDNNFDIKGGIEFYKSGPQRDKLMALMRQAIDHGKAWDEEMQIVTAKNRELWVRVTGEAEFFNGKCVRLYGSFQDIDERKRAELELTRYAKELATSNAELEQFAYVSSHDLQEPLRMVTSFLSQIERKYGHVLDEKGKQYIHFAVDGAKRMRQIILDLLEYSRIGKLETRIESVDTNALVEDILILHRIQIEEARAVISMQRLPVIVTMRSPIRQVFQNLIGNALKYHKEGQAPEIDITCTITGNEACFRIADKGIGIDEEYFKKIFVIFQRLHNREEYSGTGIGLAICKKIIESMGGKIWVEANPEAGCTFFFTIPLTVTTKQKL